MLLTVPIHHTETIEYTQGVTMYEQPIGPIQYEEKLEPAVIDTDALCNCYRYVEQYLGIDLPPMATIVPNTDAPTVGSVAVMWYGNVKHVAVVTGIDGDKIAISDGNYHRCQKTDRTISSDYPPLVGFYNP